MADEAKKEAPNEEVINEEPLVEEMSNEEVINDGDTSQVVEEPEQTELDQAREKIADLEDQLLRSKAEIQNIQQRQARELQSVRKYDGQKLAAAVLPAVDNLERALEVEADDAVAKQIKAGVEMTLKTLVQALTDNGISATGEVGETFDPTKHQAIQSVESTTVDSDQIASVLQKGYILQDRVLRPAMVAVAK
ncbi:MULTISPECIES: nucleotide exchange factor GrpE [Leuconostoc]|uniref:Protein GrpE n=2 Tax=Leuconostoc kimchii TaxID=136609 RepID=D5T3X2_LEUKI|nr:MULTISPECIES: nucleotide exchange factor GrpE [Leuconostoc]ADG41374.1 cochaperonin, Hsp70 cofactor [Leuconostoc kimchii IMSNU 11154]AEJ30646.1 cochaperonin, Hsp70 cofactor [Leuconostoc sp. C2]QBR47773.1 nucleotide exchange factor GrpE [Leuconostoc kimchii]